MGFSFDKVTRLGGGKANVRIRVYVSGPVVTPPPPWAELPAASAVLAPETPLVGKRVSRAAAGVAGDDTGPLPHTTVLPARASLLDALIALGKRALVSRCHSDVYLACVGAAAVRKQRRPSPPRQATGS